MIVAATGVFLLLVLRSPTFQECVQANQNLENHKTIYGYFASLFWVTYWCTGIFVGQNGEAITALATIVMAAFTGTLWWATSEQGKLTKEALVVSTRAFVFLENFEPQLSIGYPRGTSPTGQVFDPIIADFLFVPRWRNSGDTLRGILHFESLLGPFEAKYPSALLMTTLASLCGP